MKQGWEIKKLGEIGELKYGYTEKASLQKNGPKFLRITDIQDDLVNWCLVPYCKCNDSEYEKYKLEINDIVFARTGATTGKSFLIENLEEASVFASYLIRLRIYDKDIFPRYLMYFFKTECYWSIINQGISGSAQGGFNASKLAELHLRYPQFAEQERIVGILDSAFAKIEALRANAQQNLQNTKDLFQASIEYEFSIKDGWRSLRLNSIADVISGYAFKSGEFLNNGKFQVIRIGNVKQNFLRLTESPIFIEMLEESILNKSLLRRGDLVITQTGTKKKRDYGFVALIDRDNLLLNQRVACVRFSRKEINPQYFLYYSYTERYKNDFFAQEGGAVGQGNVGLATIKELSVPFPPSNDEQSSIIEKLDALSERCRAMEENYRQTIAHCNALKQALLTKAFNGEL